MPARCERSARGAGSGWRRGYGSARADAVFSHFLTRLLSANEPFSPRFTLCYLTGVAPQSQAGKERGYARFPGRWIIES